MSVRLSFILFSLLSFNTSTFADDRNPVGEQALYKVDTIDRNRTSSMITKGDCVLVVDKKVTDEDQREYFLTRMDCDLTMQLFGRQHGSERLLLPPEYFTEQFLDSLLQDGTYESDKLKIKHLGMRNAVNMDGRRYDNCHYVYIYDIDTTTLPPIGSFIKAIIGNHPQFSNETTIRNEDIENLTIYAYVKYGIPALGIAKMDTAFKYKGVPMKAGGDYNP